MTRWRLREDWSERLLTAVTLPAIALAWAVLFRGVSDARLEWTVSAVVVFSASLLTMAASLLTLAALTVLILHHSVPFERVPRPEPEPEPPPWTGGYRDGARSAPSSARGSSSRT